MKKLIIIIIGLSIFTSSCNTVRNSAGVNRKVIDEYNIIENPPLVIPPNFNLLPPDQIESKRIDETDSELAKEILFGLEEEESNLTDDNTLINTIVDETNANDVDSNIRTFIDEEFAGETSTNEDEEIFYNNQELDEAINETEDKKNNLLNNPKKKKKKRFIFF